MPRGKRASKRHEDTGDDDAATAAVNGGSDATLPSVMGSRAFISLETSSGGTGTLTFKLDAITCPNAVTNFRFLCDAHRDPATVERRQQFLGAEKPLPRGFVGSTVTAVRKDESFDFGTSPNTSYWGGFFKDEWPMGATTVAARNQREYTAGKLGALCMSNIGPNTNASRFFVTLSEGQGELDGECICFGYLVDGFDVLAALNDVKVDPKRGMVPRERVAIVDCGIVDPLAAFRTSSSGASAPTGAGHVGVRRGRDQDDVLSGALDVVRTRVAVDAEGPQAGDGLVQSTMAMAGALKKRRGEVSDPRFAGELAVAEIDASKPLGEAVRMPSQKEAQQQLQGVFEHDLKEVAEAQKHKKSTTRMRLAKQTRMKEMAEQRRAKLRQQRKPEKVKYYK